MSNQPLVHVHWMYTSQIQMCTHRTVHTRQMHMRAHSLRCAHPGTPTPRKEQKYIDGHTQAHPPPGNTDTSTPAVCVHVRPPSTMHSKCASHQDVPTPGDPRLQKRTGSFPRLVPGRKQGPRASKGAQPRALTLGPLPVRHPPSPWMPVWCAMTLCPAPPAPSEPSAWPRPGSARLDS